MYAYNELYVPASQETLGFMIEYAVHDIGLKLGDVLDRFIVSGYALRFEKGEPSVNVGRSGSELMYAVIKKTEPDREIVKRSFRADRTPEYWVGWALAYTQWCLNTTFKKIKDVLSPEKMLSAYHPYHEMDVSQFSDYVGKLLTDESDMAHIKMIRQRTGLSQSQLARITDVPLRTIQQYEQRQKNINHARAEYLVAIARALNCKESDLLE